LLPKHHHEPQFYDSNLLTRPNKNLKGTVKMARIDPRWKELLSTKRFRRNDQDGNDERGPFERDYDRIIHSSNFRRLKDKTQVFPLSNNDFVRTRLTHSLEVSCIGRTLGRRVQKLLNEKVINDADIAALIAAACLAHDIGNPPFGHSGEYAIQAWAQNKVRAEEDADRSKAVYLVETAQQRQDLHNFDGNAQSLRVITRIQNRRRKGGMQLTHATLGTMMKYPCGSLINGEKRLKRLDQKKCGYFDDDSSDLILAFRELKQSEYAPGAFRRHPLAFLVEAADDISNAVVDLEDTVDQGLVSTNEAIELLMPLAKIDVDFREKYDGDDALERLRAFATKELTKACAKTFRDNLEKILDGDFQTSLIDASPVKNLYEEVRKAIENNAFVDSGVLEVEAAGFQVIDGLLNFFVPALVHNDENRSRSETTLFGLFPIEYLRQPGDEPPKNSPDSRAKAIEQLTTYQRILAVTDYISGMTDHFAVDLYQKLSGIRLPS
jgi:dGTPase